MDRYGNVSALFNKKFQFKSFADVPRKIFEVPKWDILLLQEKKIHLNNVKAQLGKYNLEEWSKHTRHNDPSSFVIRYLKDRIEPELLTQAWCKFYECLNQFDVIPSIKSTERFASLHLCEAPGGFISALNHFIKSNRDYLEWNWLATTLNPQYEGNKLSEMIPDDRLLRFTKKQWHFGMDHTGDITKYYNYIDLRRQIDENILLVTADGSINCMCDPGNQESLVEYLHYCETMTALSVLGEGGTFVIKLFTMFEHSTICLLYLLNISFKSVSAFKPCTSKGGNSEVYIICLDFRGFDLFNDVWEALISPYKKGYFNQEVSMFDLSEIPQEFLNEINLCSEYFMNLQIETITNNIDNFRKRNSLHLSLIHHTKMRVANMYIKKYRLRKIVPSHKLAPFSNMYPYSKCLKCRIFSNHKIFKSEDITVETLLSIKLGKMISTLEHSNFCDLQKSDTFKIFYKRCQDHFSLYNRIYMDLGNQFSILNRNDFNCSSYSEFQREFLDFFACHDMNKNLIILNIPLVTNFLVGFFYLLCSYYHEIFVYNYGSIVLKNVKCNMKHRFDDIVHTLKSFYDNPQQNLPYKADILEIVSSDLILYNDFYHIVRDYNDSLIKFN
ncbi:cap-specific mRNA (nucleoside-2'-O-)-methyltransferase 2 [Coccinella septempunctata]|uniref:cap-specific mRNA (nucleoside-2'-O-)-methyltransferase 2 n=1 Tax=Coccinella septempunctata TaxID=41139 RepID=UPI001D06A856|nr:cap-specific mRNA (nucleoside-2'-O-)-methyltransferase 2 [Coccinella septempunctata]XP_044747043.1 cap-specific mRNA (nucleoside-2'-O-)-methyltransferase 2 [Coccinella septempunctata]